MKDKIINIFKSRRAKKSCNDDIVRYFAGFNYVKLTKDENGKPFNALRLQKYAQKCHYLVSVMREKNSVVCLYDYEVPSEMLMDFVQKFQNEELQGKIIEIDKYIPEDLA